MSQFQGVKCDECGRIQGEANHWIKMDTLGSKNDAEFRGLILGPLAGRGPGVVLFLGVKVETIDLCGQGCAMKHIAKLLGWNVTSEG